MAVITLTNQNVISAKCPEGKDRTEYFDNSLKGLNLRVTKDGAKTWCVLYSVRGKKQRYTIGRYPSISLSSARNIARDIMFKAKAGEDPLIAKKTHQNAITTEALVDTYIERHAKRKKKSWARDEKLLNKEFLTVFPNRRAEEITRREIINFIDDIVVRGAPIQANRIFEIVRRMFNFAIEQDLLKTSPCYRVKKPSKENQSDRVLFPYELKSLMNSLNSRSGSICSVLKIMLLSGQRCGEVCSVEWVDLDFESDWWSLPGSKTKNGIANRIPLTPMLKSEFLKLQKDNHTKWAFPAVGKDTHIQYISKSFMRFKARENFDFNFVPHDLRRTFASMLAQLGISRLIIRKILNHKDREITSVYDRYSYEPEKRDALLKWERQLQILTNSSLAQRALSNGS